MNLEQQVISFLSDFSAVKEDKISLNTSIATGLHMEGGDAFELFEEFSKKFGVEMNSMDIDKYFVPESAFNPISSVWSWLFRKRTGLAEVYVKDLVLAAESRVWPNNI